MNIPEPQAGQASLEDLRQSALRHYDEISKAAHVWHSAIPKAINFYFDHQPASSPPPAPETGEWEARDSGLIVTTRGNVRFLARVEAHGPNGELDEQDKETLAQIVADHKALPQLVEALRLSGHNAADKTGPCWCEADDRVFGHSDRCLTIRAALALTTLRRSG
jgi:hypothetical protein